jgi:CRP-like cAMP-binding protein
MLLRGKGKLKTSFKKLVIESAEQKSKFSSIRKNLIKQSQQLIDDSLKDRVKLDQMELFKISLPSFLKPVKLRDIRDISLISLYLVQMKKFMKIFGDNFTSIKDSGYFEQLKKISSTIIYEKFNKNRIIVKHGDEGKKFFLILKGEVQVLLPTKKNVRMKQNEFKRYMLLL